MPTQNGSMKTALPEYQRKKNNAAVNETMS